MCTHLIKRGAVYYFRRVIPKNLRSHFGATEWVYSLRTKDRDEGKERAHTESVRTDSLITAAPAAIAAGEPQSISQGAMPQVEIGTSSQIGRSGQLAAVSFLHAHKLFWKTWSGTGFDKTVRPNTSERLILFRLSCWIFR